MYLILNSSLESIFFPKKRVNNTYIFFYVSKEKYILTHGHCGPMD